VVKARDALTAALSRSPTLTEIGDYLGVDEEQVAEALEAIDTRRQLSLDQPIGEGREVCFGALLPAPTGEIELEDRLSVPDLLEGLGELECQAVVMQNQIGTELDYSQMHISRLLRGALRQMRDQLV
jgi:RNA polymerase sigma-B factor